MQVRLPIPTFIAAALLCASTMASAYDPDWKRGRIYYRSVCTACHAAQAGGSIAPSTMTKAEWTAYLQKDKHAKGKDSVKQYVSKTYRRASAARTRPPTSLPTCLMKNSIEDLKAFVIKGAKDGDAPASCS